MPDDVQAIEISLLLEAVFQRYGYDFRNYTSTSIRRRIRNFLPKSGCAHISEMIPKVLHDEAFFQQLLQAFSVTVTEIFRDPFVYQIPALPRCLTTLYSAWSSKPPSQSSTIFVIASLGYNLNPSYTPMTLCYWIASQAKLER